MVRKHQCAIAKTGIETAARRRIETALRKAKIPKHINSLFLCAYTAMEESRSQALIDVWWPFNGSYIYLCVDVNVPRRLP